MKTNLRIFSLRDRRFFRGVTLIEIIVVIGILSLLTAIVSTAVIPQLDDAKVKRCRIDIGNLVTALNTYYAKQGSYPDTVVGLEALVDTRILDKMPMDPWNKEYLYLFENGQPVVYSYGADGVEGGDGKNADVFSSELDKDGDV